jgi:uncharacterized membrane protein YhaH (DUF805 family)
MGFTDAVKTCFRKYLTFSGRASRPEYWWFILFLFIGHVVLGILDSIIFGASSFETTVSDGSAGFEAESNGPLGGLFGLVTFIPTLAAGWRRMHDTGRSGLYLLYPLIVIIGLTTFAGFAGLTPESAVSGALSGITVLIFGIGAIVLMISPLLVIWWLTRPSQKGTNGYGPHPRTGMPRP